MTADYSVEIQIAIS